MAEITICWRYPTELQIVTDIVKDEPVFEQENWRSGSQEEVTILDDRDGFVDMQFGDGSVAYHVEKTLYKEVVN